MQGVNPKRPAGATRPEVKKPARTASKVVRELFEVMDESRRSYKSVCMQAGLSTVAMSNWKAGKNMPRLSDFENVAEAVGYRIRLEKID